MDEKNLLNVPEEKKANVFKNRDDEKLFESSNENDFYKVIIAKYENQCMSFLRSKNFISLRGDELEDIFAESIIVLLEKIRRGGLILKVSVGFYLVGVCKFKLLSIVKAKKTDRQDQEIESLFGEDHEFSDQDDSSHYDFEENGENLAYLFEEESEQKKNFIERNIVIMTQFLEQMRIAGGNCYDLITLFSYERLKIAEITARLGYASDAVTKNQRSTCINSLRQQMYQIN